MVLGNNAKIIAGTVVQDCTVFVYQIRYKRAMTVKKQYCGVILARYFRCVLASLQDGLSVLLYVRQLERD